LDRIFAGTSERQTAQLPPAISHRMVKPRPAKKARARHTTFLPPLTEKVGENRRKIRLFVKRDSPRS
jgi:hypothetical protein